MTAMRKPSVPSAAWRARMPRKKNAMNTPYAGNVDQHVDQVDRVHALDDRRAAGLLRAEDRLQVGCAARQLERDDRRVVLWQIAARPHRLLRCGEQRHRQDQQAGGEADAEGGSGMHGGMIYQPPVML